MLLFLFEIKIIIKFPFLYTCLWQLTNLSFLVKMFYLWIQFVADIPLTTITTKKREPCRLYWYTVTRETTQAHEGEERLFDRVPVVSNFLASRLDPRIPVTGLKVRDENGRLSIARKIVVRVKESSPREREAD